MPLIVETGAVAAGAESYVSVAEALVYHANRNNTSWAAAPTAAQEAALRKGTAYLDGRYCLRWKGTQSYPITQPLHWPRFGVIVGSGPVSTTGSLYGALASYLPSDSIPQALKDATCEAALRALSGSLLSDMDQTVKRKKIGPIETEYFAGAINQTTTYPLLDALLSGLVMSEGQGTLMRG